MIEVVAAAIVREGRVLAARRSRPAKLAGSWEFPGGKVEPGEDGPTALVREIREELGVDVEVGARLAVASDGRIRLVLYAATLYAATLYAATLDASEPRAQDDHDALSWLPLADLDRIGWLPIDEDLLPAVRDLLDR